MAGKTVSLTAEEARVCLELLELEFKRIQGTGEEALARQTWRLAVKLDKAVGDTYTFTGPFSELPAWARAILHRTFVPEPPQPKPKPKPKPKHKAKTAKVSKHVPPAPKPRAEAPLAVMVSPMTEPPD